MSESLVKKVTIIVSPDYIAGLKRAAEIVDEENNRRLALASIRIPAMASEIKKAISAEAETLSAGPAIERDGQLPEWVGKMMNRRGIVEDTLRLPFTNNLKGLPPPDWYPPDAAKLVELANKLAVPEEFSPAQFDTKTNPA